MSFNFSTTLIPYFYKVSVIVLEKSIKKHYLKTFQQKSTFLTELLGKSIHTIMNETDLKFPNILRTKKGNTYWEKETKFDQFNVMITPFIKQTNR